MNRPIAIAVGMVLLMIGAEALAQLNPPAILQTPANKPVAATQPATTRPAPVSAEQCFDAAKAGGAYLQRMIKPDGRFVYLYDPRTDAEINDYNLLRHAGAVYALLELYEAVPDPQILKATEAPLKYLLERVVDAKVPGVDAAVLVDEEKEVKLGGNGLALLVLAQHAKVTGARDHLPVMRRLARWMAWSQAPDGRFKIHKMTWPEGEVVNWVSAYYPGEAVLSLMRLYAIDPDPIWLATADHGARWVVETRDADKPIEALPHDHWLLYALNELHRAKPDKLWLEQSQRIAQSIIDSQHGPKIVRPEWTGAWYVPPRSTPASTRVEGLLAAHALFRDFKRPEQAAACLASAQRGIAFFLTMQHTTGGKFANPLRAAGGMGEAPDSPIVRIDYVQHAMSALLAMRRAEEKSDVKR